MKLLYKPFGLVFGLLAGLLSKKIFDFVWARFDDQEAPKATTKRASMPKVIGAAALQGMVFKGTRAAVDRYGARGFEYLTGSWPGEKDPDPAGLDIGKK